MRDKSCIIKSCLDSFLEALAGLEATTGSLVYFQ